jgi:rhodanese-related sulfurtransferase
MRLGASAEGVAAASSSAELPREIGPAQLAAWRQEGAAHAILDVREPWEVAIAALDGALLVPMMEVPERLAELPRDRPLVVLCHHGARSWRVMAWLRAQGLGNAVNLAGGIDAWAREIDPAMATY